MEKNIFPAGTIGFGEDIKMMQEFINKSLRNKVVASEKVEIVITPKKQTNFVYIDEFENLMLYPNGDCFSKSLGRNIAKSQTVCRGRIYRHYKFGKKNVYINRLVMFYFGKHEYKKIEDMPMVSPIDKNVFNNDISNLEFASKGDLNKKYQPIPHDSFFKKPKIAESEIENIKKMILEEVPFYKIGKKYNVSAMSVSRFLARHKINWRQWSCGKEKSKRIFY